MIIKVPVSFLVLIICQTTLGKPGVLTADAVARDAATCQQCPAGWVQHGDACYSVQDTPTRNQSDARQHCQNERADLAIIKSAEQNDFLYDLLRSQNTVTKWGAWIGMKKRADGKFYWFDGTPVEGHYTAWAGGEPNDDGNCVQLYVAADASLQKRWNDIICQMGSQVTDAPVILCQKPIECPVGWVRRGDSCYSIQDTPTRNQNNARQHCRNEGADLAIIKSAEQNDFIYDLLRSQNTVTKWGAWIGMEKRADGKFYWFDDTPVEGHYTAWAGGEPSGDGNCVQLYGAPDASLKKRWNDIICQMGSHITDAPVILCQKPIGCALGWVKHGDSCYAVQDTPTRNQNNARQHCLNKGADLAIIKSAEQNDFIYDLLRSQNTVTKWGAWIGMKNFADGFFWYDGSPVQLHHTTYYTAWAGNGPDGDGYCVHMYVAADANLKKRWNDITCQMGSHITDAPVILCQCPL